MCNSNTEAALSPQELARVVVANAQSGYDKFLATGVRMNHPRLLFANKSEETFIVCLQRASSFIHLTIFLENHAKGTRHLCMRKLSLTLSEFPKVPQQIYGKTWEIHSELESWVVGTVP